MPEQPEIRRDEWDAEIERQIAEDDKFDENVVSAIRDTGLLRTDSEMRRTLSEMKAFRPVAAYVKRIWGYVMHEPTFEPLEPQHQGRLAARVLLICLEKSSVKEASPDHGPSKSIERGQFPVPDILREGFPDTGDEFKRGFIAELEAEAIRRKKRTRQMSDETRRKYIDRLGPERGKMLDALHEEWTMAVDRYQELMELFGKDEERVAMLNALGAPFVGDLQEVLSNDLILRLTRLTDTGKRSVSVHHLPRFLKEDLPRHLHEKLEKHVSQAKKHARSARDRRNHRIAHRDRWQEGRPVRYGDLKAGLDSVHAALSVVEMGFWNSHLMNEVISEMRTARFVGHLESLVEAVLFIESRIDPRGETKPFNRDVAKAFLAKIGGNGDEDGTCQRLRDTLRNQFSDPSFPVLLTPCCAPSSSSTALTGSGGLIQTSSGSFAARGGPATKRSGWAA